MSKRASRNNRQNRAIGRVREHGNEFSPMEQLYVAAGVSLALTSEEVADAMAALVVDGDPGHIADTLHARALEMLELLPEIPEFIVAGITCARKQIERRRGAAFLGRVAASGRPAAEVFSAKAFVAYNTNSFISLEIH
jgi:hypothetical protein